MVTTIFRVWQGAGGSRRHLISSAGLPPATGVSWSIVKSCMVVLLVCGWRGRWRIFAWRYGDLHPSTATTDLHRISGRPSPEFVCFDADGSAIMRSPDHAAHGDKLKAYTVVQRCWPVDAGRYPLTC